MVDEVSTIEIFCGDLYSAVSTREGWRRNERSNGMLTFIFLQICCPLKLGGLSVFWGKGAAVNNGNHHGGLDC